MKHLTDAKQGANGDRAARFDLLPVRERLPVLLGAGQGPKPPKTYDSAVRTRARQPKVRVRRFFTGCDP